MSEQEKAINLLNEIAELMRLNGENVFKIRAYERAAESIANEKDLGKRAVAGTLTEIDGIGKGIAETLTEFLTLGTSKQRDELNAKLPPGLLELTQVPGLGPKKALTLIETLDIHTLSELEYACKENRLIHLKGFGEKIQTKILQGIEFIRSNAGQVRIDVAAEYARALEAELQNEFPKTRIERTGSLRRKLEVLSSIDFLAACESESEPKKIKKLIDAYVQKNPSPVPVKIASCPSATFDETAFEATASPEWMSAYRKASPSERAALAKKKLLETSPEILETEWMLKRTLEGGTDALVTDKDIRGIFHVHTTLSDGSGTLDQMVARASELGYSYIGITDHSQSAFYAQGLKPATLKEQKKAIDQLQKKYPKTRIFWGIESDILSSGELDYEPKVLAEFDFVIASIHSRFQMNAEEMTARLLKAIRNPRTTMLGHLTGRLLLGRAPYAFDIEAIMKACAEHDVAIEINAHPARLDIDWRHGPLLSQYKVKTAINPDAHEVSGIEDTRFGVTVARKAMLDRGLVLNTRSTAEIEKWLQLRT